MLVPHSLFLIVRPSPVTIQMGLSTTMEHNLNQSCSEAHLVGNSRMIIDTITTTWHVLIQMTSFLQGLPLDIPLKRIIKGPHDI